MSNPDWEYTGRCSASGARTESEIDEGYRSSPDFENGNPSSSSFNVGVGI